MTTSEVTPDFIDKLRKILALTTSPVEGEAAAAAAMLQKLLTSRNLTMADLEAKGASGPGVREETTDLGKAAFQWKLDLASAIAEHYYCYAIIRADKTIQFIGRPENIKALQMLYLWLVDQIKRISADARRVWIAERGEHIDPLRWQVNFGVGCVERLHNRLRELTKAEQDSAGTALVIHHKSEISDYMEEAYGYRMDGNLTKQQQKYAARRDEMNRQHDEDRAAMADAEFYAKCPSESPEAQAAREAATAAWWAKEERNSKRRTGRAGRRVDYVKEDQAYEARVTGRAHADRLNLTPFIEGPGGKDGNLK